MMDLRQMALDAYEKEQETKRAEALQQLRKTVSVMENVLGISLTADDFGTDLEGGVIIEGLAFRLDATGHLMIRLPANKHDAHPWKDVVSLEGLGKMLSEREKGE
jgi:hypothetical protein